MRPAYVFRRAPVAKVTAEPSGTLWHGCAGTCSVPQETMSVTTLQCRDVHCVPTRSFLLLIAVCMASRDASSSRHWQATSLSPRVRPSCEPSVSEPSPYVCWVHSEPACTGVGSKYVRVGGGSLGVDSHRVLQCYSCSTHALQSFDDEPRSS